MVISVLMVDNLLCDQHLYQSQQRSVLTFHKILISRRVLEREKTDKSIQNRPDPP